MKQDPIGTFYIDCNGATYLLLGVEDLGLGPRHVTVTVMQQSPWRNRAVIMKRAALLVFDNRLLKKVFP